MKRLLRTLAVTLGILFSGQALATPVTVTLTGETRSSFSGPFNVGTQVTATWTYDTSQAPDINASQSIFNNAADSFSLNFSGYGTFTGENGTITQSGTTNEIHQLYIGNGNGTLTGPVISGLEIIYFFARFQGDTFDTKDVLSSGFSESDATLNQPVLRFAPVGGGSQTEVRLTNTSFSFQSASVPAPGTLLLLGMGFVALGLRGLANS